MCSLITSSSAAKRVKLRKKSKSLQLTASVSPLLVANLPRGWRRETGDGTGRLLAKMHDATLANAIVLGGQIDVLAKKEKNITSVLN